MDRSSGSGVFGRDPDAVLDLIQLETTLELMIQQENKGICQVCKTYMDAHWKWQDDLSEDDLLNSKNLIAYCENNLDQWQMQTLRGLMNKELSDVNAMTAWRVEGNLREFKQFDPVDLWFRYPIHYVDSAGALQDVKPEEEKPSWEKLKEERKKKAEQEKADHLSAINIAFEGLEQDGVASAIDIAEEIGVTADTVKRWFGNGQRSRKEYKKLYETYEDPKDKRLYLKRKGNTDGRGTD